MEVKLLASDTRESEGGEFSAIETNDIIFFFILQARLHQAIELYYMVT